MLNIATTIVDCECDRNRGVVALEGWSNGFKERALGVSREQAAENRRAIVAAAAQLFRERGVDAVGLNELMKHAGFTQGGFYNHFESKAALVAEVFASAMAESATQFAKGPKKVSAADQSTSALWRCVSHYLSEAHRDNIDHGCPVAGFAGDAPRLDSRAQSHFAGGLDDQIMILAGLIAESGSIPLTGERRPLRERAINLHCKMVGAVVLSRSVAEVSPTLANEILENVRREVLASLDEHSSKPSKPRKKH